MGRGRDSVTSGRNLEPGGQGWPNAAALTCFLEIVFPLTACISCCFLGGGKEDVRKPEGFGGGEAAEGSGCGQRVRGCQGSLCAGSTGLAGRNGMFPLALQEQKQLWKGLKKNC